ncbi:MAG: alanyl-tRNA editing protein [Cellulosilyticaceae bacterium]
MPTLYDQNPYCQSFIAEIINIHEDNDLYHILLNETAFYPTGGGQPCDLGYIEDCPIIDVYEKENQIYHVSPKKPIKIHKAKCIIDWQRRIDHMQQHTAQHLLSAIFSEKLNASTDSFHLGSDYCTIDIDLPQPAQSISTVFELANEKIQECISITAFYPSKQELKKLKLKKLPKKTLDTIRLVSIDDVCLDACCGTHVKNTLELMHISLVKIEKQKNGQRIYFIAGFRSLKSLVLTASTAKTELAEATTKYHQASSLCTQLKSTIEDYEVSSLIQSTEQTSPYTVITKIFDNKTTKELQRFAAKLVTTPDVIALLGLKVDGMAYLIFMCSNSVKNIDMSKLLQDSITFIDGRGGGTKNSAQGGGKSINNLESAMLYATKKLNETILSLS